MDWSPTISLVGAASGFGLALAALLFKARTPAQWLLIAGMLLLGAESLCQRFSFLAVSQEAMLRWHFAGLLVSAFVPAVWLAFSVTFARGDASRYLRRWLPAVAGLGLGLPALLLVFRDWVATAAQPAFPAGNWFFPVQWPVELLQVFRLVASVLVLTNLEWTFRAAVGTARWRIKYAIIGLALLFGTRIYTSSHALLYSGTTFQLALMNSASLVLASLLLAFSSYRSRLATADIYPSATALYKSLTLLLAGVYLTVVGLVAKFLRDKGGVQAFPFLTFFLLVAVAGLSVLWLSDRVRQSVKRFVSLHFKRPMYDYRRVWSGFTARTAAQLDQAGLCRAVVRLISETFEALSVSVWLLDSVRSQLTLAASTSLTAEIAPEPSNATELLHRLAAAKMDDPQPVTLDHAKEEWCAVLRRANPAFFPEGGKRVCMPLVAGGEVIGFLVVGDRVAGAPFSPEDLELLKCLGEQMAAALRTSSLSEQVAHARELQAFQAMSAFLVHDLKNTASTLSLMLRNMAVHYDKPAFREDALRGLSSSVQHINDLIARLTGLRQKLEVHKQPTELKDVVAAAIRNLGDLPGLHLEQEHEPLPKVPLDGPQIESVVTNLLFNARDALGPNGFIRVHTALSGQWAVLTVADNGSGMTPEFIARSLFKPFQTTKKKGLGIGMFQAKTVVDAHGGRLEVQSAPREGTTFRVWLPLNAENKTSP